MSEQGCKHDERHMSAMIRVHVFPPEDWKPPLVFQTYDGPRPITMGHTFDALGVYRIRSCQVCGAPLEKEYLGLDYPIGAPL